LAIVDHLRVSDRAPVELGRRLGIGSNLLAHHLQVLERVGLIERSRSSGDGRRRYVHLLPGALRDPAPVGPIELREALFLCTANSARSQLAAAMWTARTGHRASSAGTHPARRVHPGAIAAGERAGLDLSGARPRVLADTPAGHALVVTVCDRAHEALEPGEAWLHWSVPDPVAVGTAAAFDATVVELAGRIDALAAAS
jgi:protein-tyrosine-phosphatase